MKISHNWLQEFVSFTSSPSELSEALNMLGIEVESFEDRRTLYTNFVTAKVVQKEKHPKADKLSVCEVFDGKEQRTVVCGAPNVEAGQTIVFALPGAIVPNGGFEIAKRVLRGIESNGMICSRAELNLEDEGHGIWVLDNDIEVGLEIGQALGLADVIYEISITPNRADALSHLGIARIIAAYEKLPLRMPSARVVESSKAVSVQVKIKNPEDCPRYMARVLHNVKVAASPRWLQQKLESVGLRPRNNVVDITNFVLMECGHPLHAFDYSVVSDNTIEVKLANEGEKYTTLDAKERVLDQQTLMICDSQKRLAIAGVMGGENSSIKDQSTSVLVESAYFRPSSIRRSARRLGISSDASYRFERGTDINNLEYALNRAAQLMSELCGAEVEQGIVDAYPQVFNKQPITLRFKRVRSVLGFEISDEEICDVLSRLDCSLDARSEQQVVVIAPTYRVDISEEIDLIEEIAILKNYDSIPLRRDAEVSFAEGSFPHEFRESGLKLKIRSTLATLGLHEIVTQNQTDPRSEALVGDGGVALANPLGEELSIMRSTLVASSLKVVAHNIRQGAQRIGLFDLAKTFHRVEGGGSGTLGAFAEREELAIVLCGLAQTKSWNAAERQLDVYDLKGLVQSLAATLGLRFEFAPSTAPEFSAEQVAVLYQGKVIGVLGELKRKVCKALDVDKNVYFLRLDCTELFQAQEAQPRFTAVSPYPQVERDLAFVLAQEIQSSQVQSIIVQSGSAILRRVHLFDLFEHASLGEDKKSLAFRLIFSSHERTLTDEEVDTVIENIVNAVAKQLGATLRA